MSVKRLNPGEAVVLTDGRGRWADAVVKAAEGRDRLVVSVSGSFEEPAPAVRVTVVQALPKGDRGEVAVETMTETGVDAIVPWQASRCITQWRGDRGAKSLAKWRNTAREAGKQSRRVSFPEVAEALSTKQVAALLAEADLAVVLHEDRDAPSGALATAELPSSGSVVVVVGPEGGVSRRNSRPSLKPAPCRTGWGPRCCAPPPPAPPRRRPAGPHGALGLSGPAGNPWPGRGAGGYDAGTDHLHGRLSNGRGTPGGLPVLQDRRGRDPGDRRPGDRDDRRLPGHQPEGAHARARHPEGPLP